MKNFWLFLGALILLIVIGHLVYPIIYILRTGRDLAADRTKAAADLLAAFNSTTAPAMGQPVPETQAQGLAVLNH